MRGWFRRVWAVLPVFLCFLAGAATADAAYTAAYVSQCCSQGTEGAILEQGEVRYFSFQARNNGDQQWWRLDGSHPNPVRLGVSNPRDRNNTTISGPGWVSINRAADLLQSRVGPGEVGTFIVPAYASTVGTVDEYFEPVAEGAVNGWMGQAAPCTAAVWCGIFQRIVVRSPAPPVVAVQSLSTEVVPQGGTLNAQFAATDNVGLAAVVSSIDGGHAKVESIPRPDQPVRELLASGGTTPTTTLPAVTSRFGGAVWGKEDISSLEPGVHTITATAIDLTGRTASASKTFEVLRDRDLDGVDDHSDDCPSLPKADADGCPKPSGRAALTSNLSFEADDKSATVKSLTIQKAIAGSNIVIKCSGCPTTRRTTPSGKRQQGKVKIHGPIIGQRLRYGQTVSVTVTAEDRSDNIFGYRGLLKIGRTDLIKSESCLSPATGKPTKC